MGKVDAVFPANDSHYAYFVPQTYDSKDPVLIVDGKASGFGGQQPVFTADGTLLLTISFDGDNTGVLANGKSVYRGASVNKIIAAPVGHRWAAIAQRPGANGMGVTLLVIDGKEIPGSEYVQDVWFSPDTKRYAAVCHNPYGRNPYFMLVDGNRGADYAGISNQPPTWTADSSRLLFSGSDGTQSVTVVIEKGEESVYPANAESLCVADRGNTFAWLTRDNRRRSYSVVIDDNSVLPQGVYPMGAVTLSPDGSRYAFIVGPVGRNEITGIVLDGQSLSGVAPGYFGLWNPMRTIATTQPQPTRPEFVFSPDSKHVAYIGRTNAAPRGAMLLDGKVVFTSERAVYYPTFTPDNQHFVWVAEEPHPGSTPDTVLYVDGQEAVRANGFFFQQLPGSFDMSADGKVTFLAVDGDVAKRYEITPAADVTVATLLEKGTTAVAAAPKIAPPVASSATATPTPTTATTPTPSVPRPAAGGGEDLAWNTLERRPELWPTACALKTDTRFQDGTIVRAGTKVAVVELAANAVTVSASGGAYTFEVGPNDTDVLDVARAAWAQLTPDQRNLTYATLLQRPDLWPYRVHATVGFEVGGRTVRPNDPLLFLKVVQNQLLVRIEGTDIAVNLQPQETDLIKQARALLADEHGAPGRLLEELAGKLVSPLDGRPVALDANARPKYVVLYMGAAWCGPCRQFSPQLVKLLKDKAPKSEDVALIYLSGDKTPAERKGYVTKLGIAWPTLPYTNSGQLPAFSTLFGTTIPQLVVTDRHGKVVVDSAKVGTARALQQLSTLL